MAIRLKETNQVMVRAYLSRANLLMQGKPGIGKTCSIEAFASKMRERIPDFKVWYFYGPTMSPMDIQAAMPDQASGTLKMYSNAALPNAYVTPEVKGVLFIGEVLNTDPTTLKLLQKYVNGEDMNGCLRKPDGVTIIADSNRLEDKAGVMQQFRALLNRFLTIDVYTEAEDNIEYAAKHAWHPLVQAFFREAPALIDNYEQVFSSEGKAKRGEADHTAEEGKRGVWACMRGWNRVSLLEDIAEETGSQLTLDEIAGSVGSAVAVQYNTFKQMVGRLATLEEVVANPDTVEIPKKIDELYALATIVSLRCRFEDLEAVYTFAQRIQPDMQVYMLAVLTNHRKNFGFITSKVQQKWVTSPAISKVLSAR